MMRIVGSASAHAMGYVPGWTGIGEDIPRGVFLEWTSWVMKPRYFFDDPTLDALANFPRYRGSLRANCLTDDPWATAPAVDLLCSGFTGTTPERLDIHPRDIGVPHIGHFGFFRPENRQTLWCAAADWLRAD
jgi:predicted alpha/beta hydrolase